MVSHSSAEAELKALIEGVWIKGILQELDMIKMDTSSLAHNPVQHDRTKTY